MKYHLAVDSGGTKVHAILYDEAFHPIRACRVGSTRPTSTPANIIAHNAQELIDALELSGKTLALLCGIWDRGLYDTLCRVCTIEDTAPYSELSAGLAAAGCFGDGYLALSGTGATFFCRHQGKTDLSGGYGSVVADEGSGYWIAREAFGAAIRAYEGWGEPTLLQELIYRHFRGQDANFRNAVFSIYSKADTSPVACIAACAPLVTQAAAAGDRIAREILTRAGTLLGQQLAALQKREKLSTALPVAISGSVWKGDPVIFSQFCRVLREQGFTGSILTPVFQPIVGMILCHYLSVHGSLSPETLSRFREQYKPYLFNTTE